MRNTLVMLVVCAMVLVMLSGCALVSSRRVRKDNHDTHRFAIFEIPLWESVIPVDQVVEEAHHKE